MTQATTLKKCDRGYEVRGKPFKAVVWGTQGSLKSSLRLASELSQIPCVFGLGSKAVSYRAHRYSYVRAGCCAQHVCR